MKKVLLAMFVIVALFLNFNVSGKAIRKDISLDFVSALQVSAGEAWCLPIAAELCNIILRDGSIYAGIGINMWED